MSFNKTFPTTGFTIRNGAADPQYLAFKGRARWALENLMQAGSKGVTPITHPGPRWAAYVFKLREAGLSIETIHEMHDGPFPGNHARYVLHSSVMLGREGGVA